MRAATGWNVHRTNTTVAWPSQFELLSALWVIPRERTLGQKSGTVPSAKASRALAAAQAKCSRFFVSEETFAGLLLVRSRWGRSRWLTQWDRRALHFQNPIQRGVSKRRISAQGSRHLPATEHEARKKRERKVSAQQNKPEAVRRVAEPIQQPDRAGGKQATPPWRQLSACRAGTHVNACARRTASYPNQPRHTCVPPRKDEQKAHTFLKPA